MSIRQANSNPRAVTTEPPREFDGAKIRNYNDLAKRIAEKVTTEPPPRSRRAVVRAIRRAIDAPGSRRGRRAAYPADPLAAKVADPGPAIAGAPSGGAASERGEASEEAGKRRARCLKARMPEEERAEGPTPRQARPERREAAVRAIISAPTGTNKGPERLPQRRRPQQEARPTQGCRSKGHRCPKRGQPPQRSRADVNAAPRSACVSNGGSRVGHLGG